MNKKQNESVNPIVPETKIMPGGLEGAMKRFRELYNSYEQHLQVKKLISVWGREEGLRRAKIDGLISDVDTQK